MTLLLTNDDVRSALQLPALIDALEVAMRDEHEGHLVQPPRQNLYLPGCFLRIGAACLLNQDIMGYKAFNGADRFGVRYLVNLYRISTGELLAMVDANYLTAARTGATAGVATRLLARDVSSRVAVLGSGHEAWTNLAAVCAVRDVKDVVVFSPREHRRDAFALLVKEALGVDCRPATSAEEATEAADIVVLATNTGKGSGVLAYQADWLQPGVHLNSIGSTMPDLRELDAAVFARADHYVVDSREAVDDESGDVQQARRDGTYPDRVVEVAELVSGSAPGRSTAEEITLFKSVGTALQDVVGALTAYEGARARGIGTELGDFPVPK